MRSRREIVEAIVHNVVSAKITVDEIEEIFEQARRYRALHDFVDNTELGSIVADGVYADLRDDDGAPAPPAHCTNTEEDSGATGISAGCGLALDSLADFLDAHRFAGRPSEFRDA